jgi:uroporphyrinogen-III decarboxylase
MTDKQWNALLSAVRGKALDPPLAGFIIDSPWLPNWAGMDILDYFASDELWFEANRKAIEAFPEAVFLPGFWSEFGMCTEPSAFGARCVFPANEFPFADKVVIDAAAIAGIREPNPATDGLLPFVLRRLVRCRPRIEAIGHKIRFSVSRGPLNIATFLMGTTEFLTALRMTPDETQAMLRTITNFLVRWHALQREAVPTIDGMLVLDDIVGFMGEDDFQEFGLPHLTRLFSADVSVKFFHNDAECESSAKYYPGIGINLYNPGIQTPYARLKELTSNRIAILGNVPPRDVLAAGTPDDVSAAVRKLLAEAEGTGRLVLSCAGGMPPGVTSENIRAFLKTAGARA